MSIVYVLSLLSEILRQCVRHTKQDGLFCCLSVKSVYKCMVKVVCTIPVREVEKCGRGAHLPFLGLEPADG